MGPLDWLRLLYADAPGRLWLTISAKRDAAIRSSADDPFRTAWFAAGELALAAQQVEQWAETSNVYFGLGLRSQRLANDQRGCARDVALIPGLWLEVDVAGGTHGESRKTYFPSKGAALEYLMSGLPHPPSYVVDSGGGLHGHWVFREPWLFEDDDDREHAAAVLRGWQGICRRQTSHAIDSTHDLARVLRVPGTWNRKNGATCQVELIRETGRRFSPDDFADWLELDDAAAVMPRDVVLRTTEPPGLKLAALLEDRKFKATWEEKRKDLKDQSRSGYVFSLANQVLMAGWSDQEALDLLTSWMAARLRPGEKPKPLGWYVLAITKARTPRAEATAERAIQVERVATATEPEERLAALSALLGFKVLRIVRRIAIDENGIAAEPWFVLETELGAMELTTERIRTRGMFLNDCYGKLGRHVEISAKHWPEVSQAIAASWVTEDAPPETTSYSEMRTAVREYAERRTVTDDPIQAYDSNQVLEHGGRRWVSLPRFCDWCRIRKGMHLGPRNTSKQLEIAGCQRLRLQNLRRGQTATSLVFWSVP